MKQLRNSCQTRWKIQAVRTLSLASNLGGNANTAVGENALFNNISGSGNVALGFGAGENVQTANNAIAIGNAAADVSDTCFIDNIRGPTTQNADAVAVLIDSAGQLGTASSSRRYKRDIKPMNPASEAVFSLKPVTFRYKDQKNSAAQFGLIAEEVAEGDPNLIVRDRNSEICTVRYDAVNSMLLNKFLREHRKFENFMRVLLIQPPQSDPAQPYSSLAVLLGAWRHAGLEVDVLDLNLDFFNYITSPAFILERLELVEKRLAGGQFKDDKERNLLLQAMSLEGWIPAGVQTAKSILRSEDAFYNPRAYAWAIRTISRGLEVVSAVAYPGRISLQSFKTAFSHHSSAGIQAGSEDGRSNLFLQYCDEIVVPKIIASSASIIALSVTFQTQLIPAWTIAARVKRVLPDVRVVVGGATISRIRDGLAGSLALFKHIDAAVLYEGETAFVALVEEWQRGKNGFDAPNVMLPLNGAVRRSLKIHTENLNELASPDHAGLPLDAYWWPKPALLINSARGCYYGRCAFCMISPATWGPVRMGNSYRMRCTERVMDDLHFAHYQTGATAFNLANDVLPPKMLGEIGDAVKSSGLPLTWDSEIRLEKSLSRTVLERMSEGGCRHLRFGFETASERVSRLMVKGTTLAAAERILLDCRDLGISVGFLCQMGFPGETVDEAARTVEFLTEHNDRVSFVSLTQFALETGSGVHQRPSDFGVILSEIPAGEDLAWTHPYSRADGITLEDTAQLFEEMEAVLDRSYPDRDLFFKGGLGHAHTTLYTRRYDASQFLQWNKTSRRTASANLSPSMRLRTARDLSITTALGDAINNNWTQLVISTAEVPENIFMVDGFVLLLLFATTVPRKMQDLIDWSREILRHGDMGENLVHALYNAGLLIAEQADSRSYIFDDTFLRLEPQLEQAFSDVVA